MTDRNSETTSMDFSAYREIMVRDSLQRSEIWHEIAAEFMRLGLVSQTVRGPSRIAQLAFAAARECLHEMVSEIDKADMRFHMVII